MNPVLDGLIGAAVVIWALGSAVLIWIGFEEPDHRPHGWPWLIPAWPLVLIVEWLTSEKLP